MNIWAFFASRSVISTFTVFTLASCNGSSGDSLVGLGEEFDVAALSDPVLRLCEVTECGDYSQSECEFYLRFDSLEAARFSEDPEACFKAQVAQFNCLAEAGACDEERCYPPEGVCVFVTEVPHVQVPEALEPTGEACEFLADCDIASGFDDRPLAIAGCQIEFVSRAEIFLEDRGSVCAQSFIDFLVCIGGANVSCGADAEEEAEACPQETAAFDASCFS